MYREETEYSSNFYEYVGMANIDYFIGSAMNSELVREVSKAFREKELSNMSNGYSLQLLEQAVIILMPYCSIYRTAKEQELFVFGFGLKGVHYFKRIGYDRRSTQFKKRNGICKSTRTCKNINGITSTTSSSTYY